MPALARGTSRSLASKLRKPDKIILIFEDELKGLLISKNILPELRVEFGKPCADFGQPRLASIVELCAGSNELLMIILPVVEIARR